MRSQLRHSTEALNKLECSGRTKPIVSVDYIVGLTDGEGCFYACIPNSPRYVARATVSLRFYIKLQEKDRDVLDKIKNTLDCGSVYFQKEKRGNHTQCYRYTVGSHRDVIGKIIPFFKQHPLQTTSKRKSFDAFCKIAEIISKKEHLTEVGIKKAIKLKSTMNKRTIGFA